MSTYVYTRNAKQIGHEFQHELVHFLAEQPGLICTRLGPFTAALPRLTDQEHAAATAKPTWAAVKVDRSRWEPGRAASTATGSATGWATGATLLTVPTAPTGEAKAGTSIFVNFLPPVVVQWLRNMQTTKHLSPWSARCHEMKWNVMECHD